MNVGVSTGCRIMLRPILEPNVGSDRQDLLQHDREEVQTSTNVPIRLEVFLVHLPFHRTLLTNFLRSSRSLENLESFELLLVDGNFLGSFHEEHAGFFA